MTPVPMGINLDMVKLAKVRNVVDERLTGRPVLLYVGTMVRVRHIDFLLEMMKCVLRRVPNALLVLVGDAPKPDMQFLRTEADRLGVADSVIFTGFGPMEIAGGISGKRMSVFRRSALALFLIPLHQRRL